MKHLLLGLPFLFFFFVPSAASARQNDAARPLTVLLSGDTYGYFDITPVGPYTAGGIVRRKTVVEGVRHEVGAHNVLLLDNGNAIGYYYLLRGDRGETMVSAMKDLGYDAMTIGMYEFEYGKDALASYADSLNGLNIVCANVVEKASGKPFLRPFVYLTKGNGLTVAVLGLTDPSIAGHVLPRNVAGLEFLDPIETARKYVPQLSRSADIVVVLTHLDPADCYRLAREVPGIDLLIAGPQTDNAVMTTTRDSRTGTATWIVSPQTYGSTISRVDVTPGKERHTIAARAESLPVNATVAADLEFADQLSIAAEQQYYSYTLATYGLEPDEPLWLIEDQYTNDDLIHALLLLLLERTHSEVAIINNTFFRFQGVDFPRFSDDPRFRKVTIRLLEQIMQTNAEIVVVQLTGQQLAALKKASDANAAAGNANTLRHVQVTSQGADAWYTHNVPPVQTRPAETYRVVTTSFLTGGRDGYNLFRGVPVVANQFISPSRLEPSEDGSPVPVTDFMIRALTDARKQRAQARSISLVDSSYVERPLWRFSLARLQLNYSAGQYRATDDYRNVGLTELRASDFTRIMYEGDFRLRQESRLFIWDNRLYSVLGQSKVTDQPLQEIADDLFFETVLSLRARSVGNGISLFPSASFKYDTEFTPTERKETVNGTTVTVRNLKQQDFTIGFGAGVSGIAGFSRIRLSFTQTFDRSKTPRPDENGFNLQTMYQAPVFTALFRTEFDGTYYIKHRNSTGDTRRLLVRWNSDLSIPIGSLFIAPSLKVFLFQGQASAVPGQSPKTATAIVVGVTLGFSRDWKIQYDSFF